jgi:hypothetical protein
MEALLLVTVANVLNVRIHWVGTQGMGAGKVGVKQYGAAGELLPEGDILLVDKLLTGPLLVRRDALLRLGLLAHTACPGACEAGCV